MVDAVAREAAKGRLLLVATTDLDKAETVLWNMGAIASMGGDPARRLFRDVLIASASIPGIFPPVMIHVRDAAGAAYDEMHVDGSTTIPFFIAPEAILVSPGEPQGVRGGNIYLIVNTQLTATPRATPINTMTILARGFSSSLAHNARTALAQSEEFSKKIGYGVPLHRDSGQRRLRRVPGFRCREKARSFRLCIGVRDARAAVAIHRDASSGRSGEPRVSHRRRATEMPAQRRSDGKVEGNEPFPQSR